MRYPLRIALTGVSLWPALFGTQAVLAQHSHSSGDAPHASTGKPGDPKKPARIVQVVMREDGAKMMFIPDRVTVKRGEQIRFMLRNIGEQDHEFFLGTADGVKEHAEEMKQMPDMVHADGNARRLKPQATGEILWRFTRSGEFVFVCLIPGHLEAGMQGTIAVK